MLKYKHVIVLSVTLFAGCAGRFTLIDRTDGQVYGGTTEGSTMSASGNATLLIEGEKYSGPWIYQARGGSFSFSNFAGNTSLAGTGTTRTPYGKVYNSNITGTATNSGNATAYEMSAVGNGMVNARSQSGKFIRCIFTFNTMQNTGIGECLRNDGRSYDLNVKR